MNIHVAETVLIHETRIINDCCGTYHKMITLRSVWVFRGGILRQDISEPLPSNEETRKRNGKNVSCRCNVTEIMLNVRENTIQIN